MLKMITIYVLTLTCASAVDASELHITLPYFDGESPMPNGTVGLLLSSGQSGTTRR